ncbi:ABC transporter permease [Glycomyces xiaoerkulensis]|uniref:ABC transporter permease n=1 Tax=Glycomyces xiaoerkulensis TaxID=2038139 RepID=UPI000C26BC42|nr:ABC transporter permease [Glycomyces xiaoerkulensis]
MAVTATDVAARAEERGRDRHFIGGSVFAAIGVLLALAAFFALGADRTTTFRLDVTLTDARWTIPTRPAVIALAAVCAAAGLWLLGGIRQRLYKIASTCAVAAIVLALICWAVSQPGQSFRAESILAGSLFLSLPFIFGALAGVVCERSGVINIGIEGQFLMGAFAGVFVANLADNVYVGLLGAMLAGSLSTLLLALLATRFQVNQVVVGVILNLLALGFTGFMYDQLKTTPGANTAYGVPQNALGGLGLGFLSDIPLAGPILFDQNLFVYIGLAMVFVVWFLLFRTRWGLRTRSVGEHPAAADSMGVGVNRLRFWNVTAAGLVSGFGGAFFTIANSLAFNKNMTAGLGFVALAVMIVGRWNPIGVLAGALIFGFASQMAEDLDAAGNSIIPGPFLQMLPYAATLVVVAGLIGRAKAPAADGVPYNPGDE